MSAKSLCLAALLMLVLVAAYLPAIRGCYVWDDDVTYVGSSGPLVLEDLAVLHDESDLAQLADVLQGVAGHGDEVRVGAGRDHTQVPLAVQHLRGGRRGGADGIHRRHS